MSHFYVNWREGTSDVVGLDFISDEIIKFVKSIKLVVCDIDTIYGVPEGATKLAVISQFKYVLSEKSILKNFTVAMGRGKIKEHGYIDDRYFVGVPKGNVLLIEDVTTTGSSLVAAARLIRKLDSVKKIIALSLTDRGNFNVNNHKDVIDDFYTLTRIENIMQEIINRQKPSEDIIDLINKEFKELGFKGVK